MFFSVVNESAMSQKPVECQKFFIVMMKFANAEVFWTENNYMVYSF